MLSFCSAAKRPEQLNGPFSLHRLMRNVLIVLNERAGSLLDRDPLAVKAELRRRLAGPGRTVDVLLAHGRSIGRAIDRGAASDYDTIIVGGGDGSVGYAAHRLAGTDKALGVLPLGTVNLLARDIGVPADLDDAIAAVEESVPRAIRRDPGPPITIVTPAALTLRHAPVPIAPVTTACERGQQKWRPVLRPPALPPLNERAVRAADR